MMFSPIRWQAGTSPETASPPLIPSFRRVEAGGGKYQGTGPHETPTFVNVFIPPPLSRRRDAFFYRLFVPVCCHSIIPTTVSDSYQIVDRPTRTHLPILRMESITG